MNGSDAATSAPIATGAPSRSAAPTPSTRPRRNASEAIVSTTTVIAEITPSPGSRIVAQQSAVTSASPVAGASQDQRRHPHTAMAACPIASDAAQTAITDA